MKAAISATGPDLQNKVDPRFGRCAYLIFYDTETDNWEATPNANVSAAGGAGIRTAQSVIDRGAEAVVTGNIGPNAMQVLSGQIRVHTGFFGTVEEAVQALKGGGLADTTSPTVKDHAGMAGGTGQGGGGTGPVGGGTGMGGMRPGGGGGIGPVDGDTGMGGMSGQSGYPLNTWRGRRGRGGCGRGGGRGGGRW